jgi:hypothetical protein
VGILRELRDGGEVAEYEEWYDLSFETALQESHRATGSCSLQHLVNESFCCGPESLVEMLFRVDQIDGSVRKSVHFK